MFGAILGGAFKVANVVSKSSAWKGAVKGTMKGLGIVKKAAPAALKTGAAVGGGGLAWGAGTNLAGRIIPSRGGLPALSSGGLPALQGIGAVSPGYAGGQTMQAMPDMLAPNHPMLRAFVRAPKGYVIVRDATGALVGAVRKDVARRAGLWKPAKKPPISARDWHCFQTAQRVEKRLLKIARPALRHRGHRTAAVSHKK